VSATVSDLTLASAARIMREAVKDQSYLLLPLGQDVADYLRAKRKRLTDSSARDYESSLDKLVRYFADLELKDFEPPIGTQRVEEFLEQQWGRNRAARTYNKNLSYMRSFFQFHVRRGTLVGDPTLTIERAKVRGVYRTTFSNDQRRAIIAEQESLRDRLSLRLLLDYGLRKGALQKVQFKHFDHFRKRLTTFSKGQKVREVPIPDPGFWFDLERHMQDVEAEPHHYLMQRWKGNHLGGRAVPDKPMGVHGLHLWWYRCLANAGVVPEGTSSGERMHKARHTAGQRVLDATGNLKAVQKLLGHESIQTTGDIYADWDIEQLNATMAAILAEDSE
jgi:site-specific recombinase XerC